MASASDVPALAVYGSLAPGEANHWVVSGIRGDWHAGTVRGWVFELTWGPAQGYDGFVPDPHGAAVDVAVLVSSQLPAMWPKIDDFEGPGYERRPIEVTLAGGVRRPADIYIALTDI